MRASMMIPLAFVLGTASFGCSTDSGAVPAEVSAGTLDIYLIDVEGGNATLFVSPAGESLLVDTGHGGTDPRVGADPARDALRITEAMTSAGLSQIDHLVTTHWHADHFGGMTELAARVPIGHFIDHGPNVQENPETDEFLAHTYPELYREAQRTIVKPGDRIPIAGLDVRVLTSAGQVIDSPIPQSDAGIPNPFCADFESRTVDTSENAQSVGIHIAFGEFRTIHLGDLTWNKEFDLMCPINPIGTVDLFVVSHHGRSTANSPVLVHAIEPRVAIMNNGTQKGGEPEAMKIIHSAPNLQNLWQLHFSLLSGQDFTVPGMFIANAYDEQPSAMPVAPSGGHAQDPVHDGPAHWIKVTASADGTFTVLNSRNGFSKTYIRDAAATMH